jgi:uncharacterized protein (TIGR03905 family)
MEFEYKTHGVCSRRITFTIEDNKIHGVAFEGGCNGNAKGVSALVEGMDADDAVRRLKGITCGFKPTSCPDQLAQAIEQAKAQQ